ncbi:PepSY domain-containing protein [Photobacterium sp. MCCC 1A19761]|uniref:PepSY domain-containing protein n=1 Tax=Photobacterium sp. MCCC 1A19761 TaxID=3115000 RepID=UPI00307D34A5
MPVSIPTSIFVTALLTLLASSFHSDDVCSTQPQEAWLPMAQARAELQHQGYQIRTFQKTRSNCYKLHGFDQDGTKVDVYFSPVDLSKVKENRYG